MAVAAAMAALAFAPSAPAAPKKAPAKKPAVRKAAPKPAAKPVAKPVVKPAANPGGPIVLGTKQLPGDFGQVGITYTIGQLDPTNFTLLSAEYHADRFVVSDNAWGLDAGEKVLVLNYTVQNPTKDDQECYWGSLRFTAVDSRDVNHTDIQTVIRTGDPSDSINLSLKPAQKLNLTTAIVVPANGVIPKLIVSREEEAAVIRYDLRGKVKPIPAPFADPADPTGATARKEVPAVAGAIHPIGLFDARLEETGYTTQTLNDTEPEEGHRFFTAIFTIKNTTQTERAYYWGTFEPMLRDADGEKVDYNQTMLKASRDEAASGDLAPGEEARVRFFFSMPEGVAAKSVSLKESDSRSVVFDVPATPGS